MKKRIALTLAGALFLTGCAAPIRAYMASDKECLELAKQDCPTEPFSYISKKKVEANPLKYEYNFKSDVRGLEFKVSSGFKQSTILGEPIPYGYDKCVYSDYVNEVHALYEDELEEILKSGTTEIRSEGDIYTAAKTIGDANELYAKELTYNSKQWLVSNPLKGLTIYIYCNPYAPQQDFFKSDEQDFDTSEYFMIDGQETAEDAEARISQAIEDYYSMNDYDVIVGGADVIISFPNCYEVKSHNGAIDGKTVTKDFFTCKDSKILVGNGEEFEYAFNQYSEEFGKEIDEEHIESEYIGDVKIEEYKEKDHKCFCVTYTIYRETIMGSKTKTFVVSLYQDIGENSYFLAQVENDKKAINTEEVKKYFSALANMEELVQ